MPKKETTYLEFSDARIPLATKPKIEHIVQYSLDKSSVEKQISAIQCELNNPNITPDAKTYLQRKLAIIKTSDSTSPSCIDLGVAKIPLAEKPTVKEVKQYFMKKK